jgi:hypothetical protein
MSKFIPTWLYIKQHNITGLKYFGKTTRKDPIKYNGSGVHWTRHLKKHGVNITTLWCQLFTDKQSLVDFANKFSEENNIVESKIWANLKPEDGLMGGDTGISEKGRRVLSEKSKSRTHSEETKQKIREARANQKNLRTGQKHSPETIQKIREKRSLQITTEETKSKISKSLLGNKNNKYSKRGQS